MRDKDGKECTVCKKFYLATLGYKETSSVITTAKKNPDMLTAAADGRGKKKLDMNPLHASIEQHIQSYHPSISHYRREHAPNRLYLPHGLTIREMHAHYNEGHQGRPVDYTSYMRRVNKLNISFAQLGEEECELCAELKLRPHELSNGECTTSCTTCEQKVKHENHAKAARQAYKRDGAETVDGRVVRSIDLQKVIMLPRLPGYKSACFTRRLVAFHHTYAPIGEYCKTNKVVSVVWHESISGRKCEDIASAFELALLQDRDFNEIVYYMDNCAGQNKNYTLFTLLIQLVNSEKISAQTISLKFLEAGHTFMSADSCHAAVEKKMKKKVNVYDFADFVECINSTGATTLQATYQNFKLHEGHQSQAKLKKADRPMLSDIRVAEFRRGYRVVHYKKEHSDADYKTFDFLKAKYTLSAPAAIQKPRGIPATKKRDIVKNLVPFMPDSRRVFWNDLPVADVADLIDSFE